MATKVALTAEEFRENSQRSIALFNTEKLSTGSTQVLKSAYCNSVHFCRCNLHGACGGKVGIVSAKNMRPKRCNLHGACGGKVSKPQSIDVVKPVAICTGRVEAKTTCARTPAITTTLQSARGVWRQRALHQDNLRICRRCNLHGACGGKGRARSGGRRRAGRCNLHGACGGKDPQPEKPAAEGVLQSARGVWRQSRRFFYHRLRKQLQSARGVWRQSKYRGFCRKTQCVAICTGRVEAKRISRRRKRPKRCCNLHGACGGKDCFSSPACTA